MRPRVWIALAGLVVAAVCAVVLSPRSSPSAAAGGTRNCLRVTAAHTAALRAPVPGEATGLIVVLGDSYSQGEGLTDGREGAFPALIGRATGRPVLLDGYGSTGFTTRGYCSGRPVDYGERLVRDHLLALRPATVVVEGGVNDARHGDSARVGAAASAILQQLRQVPQVIVVGPAAPPAARPDRIAAVDRALARAAQDAGRPYVPLRHAPLTFGPDRLHPTQAGQRIIARLVLPQLEQPAARPGADDRI